MGDWPSFLDEAGPSPGLSGAADEARDRLVETFVKYIHTVLTNLDFIVSMKSQTNRINKIIP